jgi:hypothetical protein
MCPPLNSLGVLTSTNGTFFPEIDVLKDALSRIVMESLCCAEPPKRNENIDISIKIGFINVFSKVRSLKARVSNTSYTSEY